MFVVLVKQTLKHTDMKAVQKVTFNNGNENETVMGRLQQVGPGRFVLTALNGQEIDLHKSMIIWEAMEHVAAPQQRKATAKYTVSVETVNNRCEFDADEDNQLSAYIVVKSACQDTANQVSAWICQEMETAGFNPMYCPETEELRNGKFACSEEVYGLQSDYDTKREYMKAFRKALKAAKEAVK